MWPLLPSVTSTLTAGFVKFSHEAPSDPSVSLFAGLGYMQGNFAWAVGQYDTMGRKEPLILTQFRDNIETYGAAKIVSTARVASMSDLADELNQSEPAGRRSRFTTATFKADAEMLQIMAGYFVEQVNKALDNGLRNDTGFAPMLGIQPLTRNFLKEQAKRGGNVMGLSEEDGPLVGEFMSCSPFLVCGSEMDAYEFYPCHSLFFWLGVVTRIARRHCHCWNKGCA